MGSIAINVVVFVGVSAGALLGMLLRRILPEDHFDVYALGGIKLPIGLVVTKKPLVLGLFALVARGC